MPRRPWIWRAARPSPLFDPSSLIFERCPTLRAVWAHVVCVEKLLSLGADPLVQTRDSGQTPLDRMLMSRFVPNSDASAQQSAYAYLTDVLKHAMRRAAGGAEPRLENRPHWHHGNLSAREVWADHWKSAGPTATPCQIRIIP